MSQNHHPGRQLKLFNCHLCPARFGTQLSKDEHMNTHLATKPFACDTCGKAFTRRSALWNHNRVHSETYPFRCHLCPRQFKWKNSLSCHLNVHNREQSLEEGPESEERKAETYRFQCHLCTKRYKHNRSLRFHLNVHNRDQSRQEIGAEFEEEQTSPLDLSIAPLNLCARDLLQFDSEEDQQRFEQLFSSAESVETEEEEKNSQISVFPESVQLYADEIYEIIEWGIQQVTSFDQASPDNESKASTSGTGSSVLEDLKPMDPAFHSTLLNVDFGASGPQPLTDPPL